MLFPISWCITCAHDPSFMSSSTKAKSLPIVLNFRRSWQWKLHHVVKWRSRSFAAWQGGPWWVSDGCVISGLLLNLLGWWFSRTWLVVTGTWLDYDFPIILGISSSQLTKSYFSEGLVETTNQVGMIMGDNQWGTHGYIQIYGRLMESMAVVGQITSYIL